MSFTNFINRSVEIMEVKPKSKIILSWVYIEGWLKVEGSRFKVQG